MEEQWKPILGYEAFYEVSNLGSVRSARTTTNTYNGRVLKVRENQCGYAQVCLSKNNSPKTYSVHRLVMEAFNGLRPKGMQINHVDGNKVNNKLSNLEWASQETNMQHAYNVLGHPYGKPPVFHGELHPQARLTQAQVDQIRELYATGNYTTRELAHMFSVSKTTIRNIVLRIWWDL